MSAQRCGRPAQSVGRRLILLLVSVIACASVGIAADPASGSSYCTPTLYHSSAGSYRGVGRDVATRAFIQGSAYTQSCASVLASLVAQQSLSQRLGFIQTGYVEEPRTIGRTVTLITAFPDRSGS